MELLLTLFSLPLCGAVINYTNFIVPDEISGAHTSNCLLTATREIFGQRSMITIVNCNVRKEPGFSVMRTSIDYLQENAMEARNLFSVTTGERLDFVSYKICVENCTSSKEKDKTYKYHPQGLSHTDHYLVFIEQPDHFHSTFRKLAKMPDYNISATFFLVVTRRVTSSQQVANHILRMTYKYGKYQVKVLVPAQRDVCELYAFNLYNPSSSPYCAAEPQITLVNTCIRGAFQTNTFHIVHNFSALNCRLRVVAMRVPPFVITRHSGLEMQILHEIGKRMNVSFEIEFKNRSEYWGDRLPNGSWTGMMQKVFADPLSVGVGALSLTQDRMTDFDYTLDYYAQRMVWVVPTSERVPRWKLMWLVFTWNTWLFLVAIIFVVGGLLRQISVMEGLRANYRLRDFLVALMTSFQVTLTSAVSQMPAGGLARVVLVSYSIFSIYVNSLYQTRRITLLSHPPYESQINSYDEVAATTMDIGGLQSYKEVFNQPDWRSQMVFAKYATVERNKDTLYYWMRKVARDRRTITILGHFYAQYHIITHEEMMDASGAPKVYIVNEVIYIDSIRMLFAKGFPLKNHIDALISPLITSGITKHWKQSYLSVHHITGSANEDDEEFESTPSDERIILTLGHVQGAFMMLLYGSAFGMVAFLIELWKPRA